MLKKHFVRTFKKATMPILEIGGIKMEFRKCDRCGSFFMSNGVVCGNCEPKANFDAVNANSFIAGNPEIYSASGDNAFPKI